MNEFLLLIVVVKCFKYFICNWEAQFCACVEKYNHVHAIRMHIKSVIQKISLLNKSISGRGLRNAGTATAEEEFSRINQISLAWIFADTKLYKEQIIPKKVSFISHLCMRSICKILLPDNNHEFDYTKPYVIGYLQGDLLKDL